METYDKKSIKEINWVKYKIIVPTERDRNELMEAFEHLHYTDCDTNFVPVNQLIHEYVDERVIDKASNNIIIDGLLYDKLTSNNIITIIDDSIELTEFQKAYIKDVHYFNELKGECKLLISYVIKKYERVINKDELIKDIDKLVDDEIILIETKKVIFNGDWRTDELVKVNYKKII